MVHAPTNAFHTADYVELVTIGEATSLRLVLHAPDSGVRVDGWAGSGHRVEWRFGELASNPSAVETRRRLGAAALNDLRRLLPSYKEPAS